ncbi:MAG: hypothetical protein IJ620_05630 [Bacteroidales bacterium]|nr:hypothetical protein [Bacteroidales bacterium]
MTGGYGSPFSGRQCVLAIVTEHWRRIPWTGHNETIRHTIYHDAVDAPVA